MDKRKVDNNYKHCTAAKIRDSIDNKELHLDAAQLFAKLINTHAEQISHTYEHHNVIVFHDDSTLKVLCTEQSHREGKHPTPTSLSVWDGTLK